MSLTLYVVSHKKVDNIPSDRVIIGVGANCKSVNTDIYDNIGEDNIHDKNPYYCELTALYWMWKNDSSDYVGLEHYRRLFLKKGGFPISKQKIQNILDSGKVILPKKCWFGDHSVKEQFVAVHGDKDLNTVQSVIREFYPEYVKDFDSVMDGNKLCIANMFVMPKKLADEYCEWLFDILFKAERKIDFSDYSDYQKRVFGFLSERLFNVWVHHKNLKVKYLDIPFPIATDKCDSITRLKCEIKYMLKKIFKGHKRNK